MSKQHQVTFLLISIWLSIGSLLVLCGDRQLRNNPTTLLVIFLSLTNLLYTTLLLPLNSLAMLRPRWGMEGGEDQVCRYMEENQGLCKVFSFSYYWSFSSLLFLEVSFNSSSVSFVQSPGGSGSQQVGRRLHWQAEVRPISLTAEDPAQVQLQS